MAQITLTLDVDASKGTATLKQFAGDAEAATKKAGDAAKEGGKGFGQFASSLDDTAAKLKNLLTVENLVGAGIGVALVESLHSAMSAAEAYGEEIRRMSLITGAATEELSALVTANVEMGGSTERLQRALFLMSTQIEAGGPKLKQMGIDIRDSNGYLKNETSLLYEVSDAFHNMTDKSLAAAEARKIFGRGAADLIPLLMAGSEKLREMGIDAQTFGVSLSAGAVQALHEAEIETGKYGLAMLGIKNTLTQDFLPAHSLLMQGLTAAAVWFRTLPDDIRVSIEVIVTLTASVVALGVALATLKTVASVINLASIFTTALGSIAGITAALLSWPALLAGLSLALVIGLLFDVGGIRTTIENLASTLTIALSNTVRSVVGLPPVEITFSFAAFDSWLAHAILNLRERLAGVPLTPALNEPTPRTSYASLFSHDVGVMGPNSGLQAFVGAEQRDMKQLVAEKQEEMRLNALLGASEVELAKATLPPLEAQLVALKKQNQARIDAIEIEKLKDTRPGMTAQLNAAELQQQEAYAASVEKIHADMAARDEARDKKAELEHNKALFAGEDLLKANMGTELKYAQKELEGKLTYLQDDSDAVKEFTAKKQAAQDQYAAGMKAIDVRRATEVAALYKQEYDLALIGQKQIQALGLAGVEADKAALDLKRKNFEMSEADYVAQAQAMEGQMLAIKFAYFQQESEAAAKKAEADRAALDTEILSAKDYALKLDKIDLEEQKTQADINLKRVEATDATLKQMTALNVQAAALHESLVTEATGRDITQHLAALDQEAKDAAGNADLLRVIDAKRFADRQTLYDREVKTAVEAWAEETGHYESEAEKQLAIEAGKMAKEKTLWDTSVQHAIEAGVAITQLYQTEADKQLAIEAGKFTKQKAAYDRSVQDYINAELAKTGYLDDALTKRLAEEAGYIHAVEQLRQQYFDNAATVLEQQARQEGDLWAAFGAGFAHATSSAQDAFKAMGAAGTKTFDDLKSGTSDFFYEVVSTSGKIGDVFANLGKRILRTMTDTFAEIVVKWAMTAAGFSLPTLLGTGTAVAGTAASTLLNGDVLATTQAKLASLGDSATGATSALAGVAEGGSVVSVVFAAITKTVGMFASGIVEVLQFLGSLVSGSGGASILSSLSSGLSSILSTLSSGLSSITSLFGGGFGSLFGSSGGAWSNAAGAMGSGAGSFGSIGALSQGMQFITQAAPWIGAAYGLYQMFSGNLSPMSGAIQGAAIGTMVLPGVGTVIGGIVGTIAGFLSGLFGGPTPEISGKTVLKPTDIAGILAAMPAVHWGENGPTVVNPPGRSQFSYLDTGPFHEEMYYHRSEGQLSREQSQISIMNVILGTLQAAVKSAAALIPQMPTADLSKALSDRLHAVLAAGFEITNFDVEGGDAVKKFGDYLKALSAKTLDVFSHQIFPTIDLKALGGGDVIKGWDALSAAMGAMGGILKAVAKNADLSSLTLNDFAERSIAYFKQFAKAGEAFPDTVKRISTALSGILDIQDQVAVRQRALTGDVVESIAAQGRALMAMIGNINTLADALHVAVEANASPEEVLKAAQSLLQAYDAAIQMAQQLKAQIDALNAAITAGVSFAVELTQKIDALRGTVADPVFMQAAIDGIVALFNAITDVTARISLFASGLLLLSESAGGILGNIPLVVEGFNRIMAQISQMANPNEAIAALKGLAQAVEQGLAAAIQATQAHYAKLRQAAQDAANAEIAALEAQKKTVQQHYQDQITALTDLQNQATALDTTLKSLRSAIQSATQFLDSLTTTIAKLSNTYSGGAAFDAALNSVAQRIEQLRGLTNAQDALSGLQSLAQDVQAALQAAIQEVQQHYADLKQAAQDASQARITTLQDERAALQQHYADLKTAAQDAANVRVTALQDEKTAIQTTFEARKAALQTELALAQQWATVLNGVKTMQKDIFMLLAPTHPVTSLKEVQSQLVSAFAQFQASRTPEAATAVQDLAKQVLDLAKQTPGYELPTANFQALAAQIQLMLGTITGAAGSQRDPVAIQQQIADLTTQENDTLKSIDEQIKAVNTDLQSTLTALSHDETDKLKQIDDRIAVENQHLKDTLKELSRQEQVQIAALNARAVAALTDIQHEVQARVTALQALEAEAAAKLRAIIGDRTIEQFTADTTAQIKTLQEKQAAELAAIDAKIAAVNANLQATLTSLSQQEQAEIRSLQNLAAAGLEAIRAQLIIQISSLADQQARAAAALQAVLGDKTYEQFIAEKQRQATELLHGIDDTLQHYLSKILDKIAPGTEAPTQAQLREVSANLLTLAELAQGGNLPTLAQPLAGASVSANAGDASSTLSALSSSAQIMDAMSWFHSGIGGDIFRQFQDLTSLVRQGQYLSAIRSVATLLRTVEDAGIVTLAHVPGFAEGTDFVPNTGLAMLHRGERVLTAAENRTYSNGSSGETTITVHFAPTVSVTMTGTESPQRAKRIIDEAVASLLSGPSRTRAELVRFTREHR